MRKCLPNNPGIPRLNRRHLTLMTSLTTRRADVVSPNHLKRSLLGMSQTNEPPAHFARIEFANVGSMCCGCDLKRLDQVAVLYPSPRSKGGSSESRPKTVKLRV